MVVQPICEHCNGHGTKECYQCEGTKKIEVRGNIVVVSIPVKIPCPSCGGTGRQACSRCRGTGRGKGCGRDPLHL